MQSILSSETLITYNKKQHKLSSEGKYTTPTFKALKIRYIALKNDTIKSMVYSATLFIFYRLRKIL